MQKACDKASGRHRSRRDDPAVAIELDATGRSGDVERDLATPAMQQARRCSSTRHRWTCASRGHDPHLGRTDRRHRGAQGRAAERDVGARSRARGVRAPVQGLCRDRAGRRGGARGAAAARRARRAAGLVDDRRRRAGAARDGGRGAAERSSRKLPEAERALALKLLPRDAADERAGDARDPRRHRRRRGRPVRRRPAAHVPALCRGQGLAVRADLGERRPKSAASRR